MFEHMKAILLTYLFLFVFGLSAQEPTKETIKGTWALTAITSSDTNLVVMFKTDTALQTMLMHQDAKYNLRFPANMGRNFDYLMLKNQYVAFDNKKYITGFSKDTNYKTLDQSFDGKFKLSDNEMTASFIVLRFEDAYLKRDVDTEYTLSFVNGYLVMTRRLETKVQVFYYHRISNEVLFK